MSKGMKWGLGIIAVVAVGGFAAAKLKGGDKGTEVRMEAVQKRDLVASVTASGQVQPVTKVDVAADISGRIVRLAVKEGDIVKRGQFLLEIDPAQYQAAVQRVRSGGRLGARVGGAGQGQPRPGDAQLRAVDGDPEDECHAHLGRGAGAAQDRRRGEHGAHGIGLAERRPVVGVAP